MKFIKLNIVIIACLYVSSIQSIDQQQKREYLKLGAMSALAFGLGFTISKVFSSPEIREMPVQREVDYRWSLAELKKSFQEEIALIDDLMQQKGSVYFDDKERERAVVRVAKIDTLLQQDEVTAVDMQDILVDFADQKRRLAKLNADIRNRKSANILQIMKERNLSKDRN